MELHVYFALCGQEPAAADFVQLLSERLGRAGQRHELAREREETAEQRAERPMREWLAGVGWREEDLSARPKGGERKTEWARALRRQTADDAGMDRATATDGQRELRFPHDGKGE